jgi:hypothetical protein
MPPALIGGPFPWHRTLPEQTIFEVTDYGGVKSTVKARITSDAAKSWCENWRPSENIGTCAEYIMKYVAEKIYRASANCDTGDMWADNRHYTFDGPEETGSFNGYVTAKDASTGQLPPISTGQSA